MIMLAIGALIGSFVFSVSNYMIETQGGFLRKFALKSAYLRREVKKRDSIRRESQRRESLTPSPLSLRKPSYGTGYLPVPGADGEHPSGRPEPSKLSNVMGAEDLALEKGRLEVDDSRKAQDTHSLLSRRQSNSSQVDDDDAEEEVGDHSRDLGQAELEVEQEFMEKSHDKHVGMAIWLGILTDAFPESLVIGILVVHGISYTFIAGVFVSNLPEAMSSSAIMYRGGFSRLRILLMWLSITAVTGLGAVIGTAAFAGEQSDAKYLAELTVGGIAAGAMLVMIAETALPEAFRHAGNLVGFSTLFGFLTAYIIKLFEEDLTSVPHP